MMGWLGRLFGSQPPPARRPAPPPAAAEAVVETAVTEPAAAPLPSLPPLAGWLFEIPVDPARAPTATEARCLAAIDEVLARPRLPPELLPRTASLVPQLIAMLRQGHLPVPVLAERIAKDPAIAAEVLRLSRSAYYRPQDDEISDLGRAITVLGADGLQIAITKVVLRPLYQAQAGTLTARLAPRLWEHADALARLAAAAAPAAGVAVFDGYLGGLLHDTGWTVMARIFDAAALALPEALSGEAAARLESRAHRLFGLAAQPWDITPAFASLAAQARTHPLADTAQPLAAVLLCAHAQALAELARD